MQTNKLEYWTIVQVHTTDFPLLILLLFIINMTFSLTYGWLQIYRTKVLYLSLNKKTFKKIFIYIYLIKMSRYTLNEDAMSKLDFMNVFYKLQ